MLFISPEKLFLFSMYLNFCHDFSVMQKNGLIRKIRLISKFMTSQTGKQTIGIHMLLNISRSKDNRTMKFGQLIQYNMRNIFLDKSYTNVMEKIFSNPFLENQQKIWINSLKSFIHFVFIVCQVESYRNILKLS